MPSQTEQLGEKGLSKRGDQEPNGHSSWTPEILFADGRTFQKDNHLYSTPQMVEWPDGSFSTSVGVCQKGLPNHEKTRFSGLMKPKCNSLVSIPSVTSGGNQIPLITWPIPSLKYVKHGGGGCFLAAWTGRLVRIEGKMNGAERSFIKNLLQRAQDLRLEWRFTFQQNNDPKRTVKTTQEWFQDCECSSRSNISEETWKYLCTDAPCPISQNLRWSAKKNGRNC